MEGTLGSRDRVNPSTSVDTDPEGAEAGLGQLALSGKKGPKTMTALNTLHRHKTLAPFWQYGSTGSSTATPGSAEACSSP